MAIKTIPAITRLSHASRGMRLSFMPGHRMQRTVAIMLIDVPMLPNPETKAQVSNSLSCARARTRVLSKAHTPTIQRQVRFLPHRVRFLRGN